MNSIRRNKATAELAASLAASLLEEAADKFESDEWGWGQNAYLTEDGNLCAMGGVYVAGHRGFYETARMVLQTLREKQVQALNPPLGWSEAVDAMTVVLHGRGQGGIAAWNDRPERTKQEVVDLMKETAKGLRNGEIQAQ